MDRLNPEHSLSEHAGRRRPASPQLLALVVILIVLAAAASACTSSGTSSGPSPTATPAPAAATKAPAGPTAAPAPAAVTAGALADVGKTVFASKCAGCHGANGQGANGPANIGPSSQLAKYATAKGLYDKVSTTMPKATPGSLTVAEYVQVTAFLLVQNNFVKVGDLLDLATFATILIK